MELVLGIIGTATGTLALVMQYLQHRQAQRPVVIRSSAAPAGRDAVHLHNRSDHDMVLPRVTISWGSKPIGKRADVYAKPPDDMLEMTVRDVTVKAHATVTLDLPPLYMSAAMLQGAASKQTLVYVNAVLPDRSAIRARVFVSAHRDPSPTT